MRFTVILWLKRGAAGTSIDRQTDTINGLIE